MTKHTLLIALFITLGMECMAQTTYPITTFHTTPTPFRYLLLTNQQIEDNDTINEEIVDLVTPMVQDSVLGRHRKPHHRLFLVGWLIHTFGGYGWRAVDPVKQKYVGTVIEDGRSGEDQFTEYDINFTIAFHTKYYLWKIFKSYDKQKRIHHQDFNSAFQPKRHPPTVFHGEPFDRDSSHVDGSKYSMHCELTPPKPFRPMLHYLFYPAIPGINTDVHPNFRNSHPTMGFYGASCLDCNHSCHPEIHPYEWIWWMNLHNGTERDKTWLLGMMKESSNRFPTWSTNPKTGKVAIPFAYEVRDTSTVHAIIIEHLVFFRFIDSNLVKLNIPPSAFSTEKRNLTVTLSDGKGDSFPIAINFTNEMVGTGLRYWFTDVNWDRDSHILSGWFNVGTSVRDIYTMKVTMSGQ